MKATKITQKELFNIASTLDAVGFDAWCDKNKVDVSYVDVTLTDLNDGYYNVELPDYNLDVCYYDGVLQFFLRN